MLVQSRRERIVEPHRPDERVRVQHVGRHVEALSDAVLEQAVDDDHVAPDELLPPGPNASLPVMCSVASIAVAVSPRAPARGIASASAKLVGETTFFALRSSSGSANIARN